MKAETFKCDVCQVEKQASNHWFKGYLVDYDGGVRLDGDTEAIGIMVLPWDSEKFVDSNVLPRPVIHLCGQQHAIQWANQQLSRKVQEKPDVQSE